MGEPPAATVDVEGMLCAQALAVVDQAMKSLQPGGTLRIHYGAEDVRHDLLVWAREHHYPITEEPASILRMTQREPR